METEREPPYTRAVAVNDPKKLALFGGKPSDATDFSKPKAKQDALGNKIPEPEEELRLIEKEIVELKVAFDQFFLGMDRRSPGRRRDQLWERIRRFKTSDQKLPTIFKFRFEQAQSKLAALDRGWNRTLMEIESGRYSRDLFKLKRKQQAKAGAEGEATQPPAKAKAAAPPTSASGLSQGQLKSLYETYVMARQRTNEPTQGLSMESLGKSLSKQVPALLQQFQCDAIDFKVVIKNNKAVLKAVPRK